MSILEFLFDESIFVFNSYTAFFFFVCQISCVLCFLCAS